MELSSNILPWHSPITWHHCNSTGFQGRSCHKFGSATAPCWAQSLCSVDVHISWHYTYRDNGHRSPKLPLSSGSSEIKADMICQDSISLMLVTASCSCQDALHWTYPGDAACPKLSHMPSACFPPRGTVSACYCFIRAFIALPRNSPFFPPAQPLIIPARSHSPSQDGPLDVHWA